MTIDEARALAEQISTAFRQADVGFILAVEVSEGRQGGVWSAGGNHSSLANMVRSVLDGVVGRSKPGPCEACNAALGDMETALVALTPAGAAARTCH